MYASSCERPNSRHRPEAFKCPLSLKADNHPDQISSYNCGDSCPPAPPLSTASDRYGWLCEEFVLARVKPRHARVVKKLMRPPDNNIAEVRLTVLDCELPGYDTDSSV